MGAAASASRSPAKATRRNGEFFDRRPALRPAHDAGCALLLHGRRLLCNDAKLEQRSDGAATAWRIIGDPTEGALVVAGGKGGLWQQRDSRRRCPRVQEIPFDSERKRMTTIHRNDGCASPSGFAYPPLVAIVKGAPDVVLELCTPVQDGGRPQPLTHAMREQILDAEPRRWRARRCACWRSRTGRSTRMPTEREAGDGRARPHLRRPARHDRPAAAGGDRGA